MRHSLLVLLLMSVTVSVVALDRPTLVEFLETERAAHNMPGLRAAVRFADGEEVRAAVGFADIEAEIALDDTTPMPGGSTGKTFVAALVCLLVEDGTLSLDDRAATWLGETGWYARLPNADSMRVRDLLSHSSGIRDYPDTMGFQVAHAWRALRRGSSYFTPEELIDFTLDRRALFEAGHGFAYSDTGYLVLGRLLEAATGSSYHELLNERILQPLSLEHVVPVVTSNPAGVPPGYLDGGWFGLSRNLDAKGRMKLDPATEWTGGGLNTTPTMLVRFYAALAEGRVVQPATFTAMVNGGYKDPAEPGYHYGFGLFVTADGETISHGGRWPGYRSRVLHHLPSGTSVAVQTNRDGKVDLPALVQRLAALQP